MPPVYPVPNTPSSRTRLYWGPEASGWGHAPGTQSGETALADLVDNVTDNPQVNTTDMVERTGATSGIVDRVRTQQHEEVTVTGAHRANNFSGFALAYLMGSSSAGFEGNAVEAHGAVGSKTYHSITPAWGHNRVPTKTLWEFMGSKTVGSQFDGITGLWTAGNQKDYRMFLAATIKSWAANFTNAGMLNITAMYDALWPVTPDDTLRYLPPPSGSNMKYIGTDYSKTRTRASDALWQFTDRNGQVFPAHIIGGSVTINRPSTPLYARQSSSATAVPLATPSQPTTVQSSGGALSAGTYQYATAFAFVPQSAAVKDKQLTAGAPLLPKNIGGIGPLSTASAQFTATLNQKSTVTISSGSPADSSDIAPSGMELLVLIFRTRANGTKLFLLDVVSGTSLTPPITYVDTAADSALSQQVHAANTGLSDSSTSLVAQVWDSRAPIDFEEGDLALSFSLDILYEGIMAGGIDTGATYKGPTSVYRDFLDFIALGSGYSQGSSPAFAPGSSQQVIQWRDADYNLTRITFYPATFDGYQFDRTGSGGVVCHITGQATNSIADVNAAVSGGSGGLTAIRNILLYNDVSSAMLI